MPFLSQRSKLQLTDKELENLKSLSNSRTAPLREVERAKILLYSHQGINDSQIAEKIGTNRQKSFDASTKLLHMESKKQSMIFQEVENHQRSQVRLVHGLFQLHARSQRMLDIPMNSGHTNC
jgi:hypothetical protein